MVLGHERVYNFYLEGALSVHSVVSLSNRITGKYWQSLSYVSTQDRSPLVLKLQCNIKLSKAYFAHEILSVGCFY